MLMLQCTHAETRKVTPPCDRIPLLLPCFGGLSLRLHPPRPRSCLKDETEAPQVQHPTTKALAYVGPRAHHLSSICSCSRASHVALRQLLLCQNHHMLEAKQTQSQPGVTANVHLHQSKMACRSCLTVRAVALGLSLVEAAEALLAGCEGAEGEAPAPPCCRGGTVLAASAASVALAVRIAAFVGFPRCRRGRTVSAALLPWVPLLLPPSKGISTVRCCK